MPHPQSPLSGKQLASFPKHALNPDGEPTIPTAAFSPIRHPAPSPNAQKLLTIPPACGTRFRYFPATHNT